MTRVLYEKDGNFTASLVENPDHVWYIENVNMNATLDELIAAKNNGKAKSGCFGLGSVYKWGQWAM